MENDKINKINDVIKRYFNKNPNINLVRAKDLMPTFIEEKIFEKDHRDGLPIRMILRELDDNDSLNIIPSIRAERKKINTYWYFERINY